MADAARSSRSGIPRQLHASRQRGRSTRRTRWLLSGLLLLGSGPALAAAPADSPRPSAVIAAPAGQTRAQDATGPGSVVRSYAEREAQAQLEQWSGGEP